MCQALYPKCAVCSGVCSLFFAMSHAGEAIRKLNSSLSTGFKREKKIISICSSSTGHDCVVFLQLSVSSINYFLVIHPGVCGVLWWGGVTSLPCPLSPPHSSWPGRLRDHARESFSPSFHLAAAAMRAFPKDRFLFLGTIQSLLARTQGKHFNSHKPGADEAKALVKQTHGFTCAAGRAKHPWMI